MSSGLALAPLSLLCSNGTFSARPSLPVLFSITPQPSQGSTGLCVPISRATSSLCVLHLFIMSIVYLHPKVGKGFVLFTTPPQHLKQGLAHSRHLTNIY